MPLRKLSSAMGRTRFKEQAEHYISGALSEYAKAEVSERNGYTKYVAHWRGEVERLIWFELRTFIAGQTLKTKFERRKAIEEVTQDLRKEFPRWLEAARTTLAGGYFHSTKRRSDFKLPDVEDSAAAFWLMIDQVLDSVEEEAKEG
jgi:hypothetical protein